MYIVGTITFFLLLFIELWIKFHNKETLYIYKVPCFYVRQNVRKEDEYDEEEEAAKIEVVDGWNATLFTFHSVL